MEYKTIQIGSFPPKQEIILNELAKDGWDLICISFNIAYLKKESKTVKGVEVKRGRPRK